MKIESDSESDSDILEISDVLVDTRILTPVKSLCSDDSNDDSSTEDVSLFSKPLAQSSPIHSRCTSPINSDKSSSKVAPLLQTKISATGHNDQDTNNDDPKKDKNEEDKSIVEKDDDLENDKDNENRQVEDGVEEVEAHSRAVKLVVSQVSSKIAVVLVQG